jgi:transposase
VLTLPATVRVFVCTLPTDMRRSFDGLSAMASSVVQQNPLSGHLFVFRNKSGDRLKVLYWDRDGLCIWYKRLEKGTFELPAATASSVEISSAELSMLIDGIALNATRRKRFVLAPS